MLLKSTLQHRASPSTLFCEPTKITNLHHKSDQCIAFANAYAIPLSLCFQHHMGSMHGSEAAMLGSEAAIFGSEATHCL